MSKKKVKFILPGYATSYKTIKKSRKRDENFKNKFFALDYVSVGWYIIIPILFFLTIGLTVANYLNWKKEIVVLFLILGVISSFYNLFKFLGWRK